MGRWVLTWQTVCTSGLLQQAKPERISSSASIAVVPFAVALQKLQVDYVLVCKQVALQAKYVKNAHQKDV